MSVALFLRRTPVRNVPLPRAWSPGPSGPPSAVAVIQAAEHLDLVLDSTPAAPGVRLSAKSVPSVLGHQADGMAPLGKIDEGRPQRGARSRSSPGHAAVAGSAAEQPGRRAATRTRAAPRRPPGPGGNGGGSGWRGARRRSARSDRDLDVMVRPRFDGSLTRRCPLGGLSRRSVAAGRRRLWNGADSMMPISRAEGRPSSFSSRSTIRSTVSTS